MEGMPERELLVKSQKAAAKFATYTQEQVDKIVEAVAAAAFGVVEHKVMKNQATSLGVAEFYRGHNFVGYEVDEDLKLVKFAKPAGVVLGVVPCTNPVATINYKTMVSLLGRNTIVFCPHPAAKECCVDAADHLAAAAVAAGAPENTIQVLREPSITVVGAMMQSEFVNVILATGGPGMVRAAYSSGTPAIGVGPGNVGHYVDDTTDIVKAAGEIVFSASFDNNLLCTSESVILAKAEISDLLVESMTQQGAFFVRSADDVEKLRNYLYPEGAINPESVGKSAQFIAEKAGIEMPDGKVLLCVEISQIDYQDKYSCEKMFPVVGFMTVENDEAALKATKEMIAIGGKGHSAAVHSENSDVILAWSTLEVCRVGVNGPAVFVSSGVVSGLNPTATLGTGFFGRSSVGDNVGPEHLVQWTKIAYNSESPEGLTAVVEKIESWKAK
jgi:acyl-CoA reductase-like NAD-dependent aldehyde dehydrogenase